MDPFPIGSDAPRSARLLHLALAGGLALIGATFLLLRLAIMDQVTGPTIPWVVFAAVSLGQVSVALAVFRRRIPARTFNQSVQAYWSSNDVRSAAIIVWALLEGAGLFAAVGYLLTGQILAGVAAVVALLGLVSVRPSNLETEGAA